MARLRIRIELSRGGVGVPLRKLASVIVESQKFLNLLTEDVRVDKHGGEWLGFDFDRESLNFTAEYVGPVTSGQVEAFNAAFGGTTSLRRDTIGQFLRITDSIGEDEVIGFGLFEGEGTQEPTEWRCLSRRDALRIADEVQVLLGAGEEPHLPAASDRALGARMFGDRRDRQTDQHALEKVRAVESGLSTRIERLESQVEKHSGLIQDVRTQSTAIESSVMGLLSTFENFCDQATRKIEQMSPRPIAAPVARIRPPESRRPWMFIVAGMLIVALVGASWYWASPPSVKAKQQATAPGIPKAEPPVAQAAPAAPLKSPDAADSNPPPARVPARASVPAQSSEAMNVDLQATETTWVSMRDSGGALVLSELMLPGAQRAVTLTKSAILRAGNAGGLVVRLNGEPIGPIGPSGQVRDLEFKNGAFKVVPY